MSDGRRRRYRKTKDVEKRPITLAKREDKSDADLQPKILLKTKGNDDNTSVDAPLKTIIVTRSEAIAPIPTQNIATISPVNVREQTQSSEVGTSSAPILEPVPQMTRPATVVSSTGLVNANARKLLDKTNTDFLVVGVIGTQGVGKSTIMNILANEEYDYDYYKHIFVDEDGVFPTKLKQHKCSARSRTESTHMFITSHRLILLDSPPVLCNSYKKDMTTNELDDLRHIISFLSVCHLLIVVQDDYMNMNFLRLLQLAELMKPMHDTKPFNADYFPNLMFVKNRAKRLDYEGIGKQKLDNVLRAFFKDTQLRVHIGETATDTQQQRKKKPSTAAVNKGFGSATTATELERPINSFYLPEVSSAEHTPYHGPLAGIIEKFRNLVFMTPRNEMYAGPNDLTESIWFELLTKVAQDTQHFFFNTYEDIQRRHFDLGNAIASGGGGGGGDGSGDNSCITTSNNSNQANIAKDMQESWRD